MLAQSKDGELEEFRALKLRYFPNLCLEVRYEKEPHLREEIGQALKDICNGLTKDEGRKSLQVALSKYQKIAPEWCRSLEETIEECLAVHAPPRNFHRKLCIANGLES